MSDKKLVQNGQCLMIKTKDCRKFFTFEKNYIQLLEFSKMFNAEVSVVKVKEAEVLDLEQLAPALCDATYVPRQPAEYQVLEVRLSQKKRTRDEIMRTAKKISDHVKESFLDGKVVTLRDLAKKFNGVTAACLCNHLSRIRQELDEEGHVVEKLGGGKYQITK